MNASSVKEILGVMVAVTNTISTMQQNVQILRDILQAMESEGREEMTQQERDAVRQVRQQATAAWENA